jgi:small-conductance mechanosensitive channel
MWADLSSFFCRVRSSARVPRRAKHFTPEVREALIAAACDHSATLSDPEPTAYLEKFGDSTIDFELVAWTQEMSYKPRRFKSDLNYLIYEHLAAAGIEIPNPQRDLHIRDGVIKVQGLQT